MDKQEKERLKEVLLRHANQLTKFLSDPERDSYDLHFIIAGQLRVLLCDSKIPILLYYAKENHIPLKVWGSYPAGHIFNRSKRISTFDALVASFYETDFAYEMTVEEYLDTEIGSVLNINGGSNKSIPYTPKNLIKWISNKEGVTHLELGAMQSLESVKDAIQIEGFVTGFSQTDAFILRNSIIQIAEWTLSAIEYVLIEE